MAESKSQQKQAKVRVLPKSLTKSTPTAVEQTPKFLKYTGSTLYSRSTEETEKLCKKVLELENLQEIGFDMEWKIQYMSGKPQNKTALIQLCYETELNKFTCLCLHVFFTGVTPSLKEILVSEKIKKVGVNLIGDAPKFYRDFNVEIAGIVELMHEAKSRILDEGATIAYTGKTNLQTLCEKVLGLHIEKDEFLQKSNWEFFNLSPQQINYAVLDAYAHLLIYKKIIHFKKPTIETQSQDQNSDSKTLNNQNQSEQNQNSREKQNKISKDGNILNNSESSSTFENVDLNLQISDGNQNKNNLNSSDLLQQNNNSKNSQEVNMLMSGNFDEWEKNSKNVQNLSLSKLQVYNMFMIEGKSFQEISQIKNIKLSTVKNYFCDAIQSGFKYQYSTLNIPEKFSQKLLQRIDILYPELAEIISEAQQLINLQENQAIVDLETGQEFFQQNQQMEVDETENKENNSLKVKIQNLFGQKDCRDFGAVFKENKKVGLKELKGDLETDYDAIKFQLAHWGRILYWILNKE